MIQRIPLDHLTSDQLDALYDRLEHAVAHAADLDAADAADSADAAAGSYAARAERAEAAIERVRAIHSRGRLTGACNDCGQPWPCEVSRALDQAQQPAT